MNAFVISAYMRIDDSPQPVVGVLFVPDPPNGKALKTLGFFSIQNCDSVKIIGSPPTTPTIYFFPRVPNPSFFFVAKVKPDYTLEINSIERRKGEPHIHIPQLSGVVVDRLINPRAALSSRDVVKAVVRVETSGVPPKSKRIAVGS